MRALIHILLVSFWSLYSSSFLWADGGTIRLSEQKGTYRITVFTSPAPLRAGPVDVSVFVQDAATGAPTPDVRVTLEVKARGSPGVVLRQAATAEAATNKLYRAANFDLPKPGWYALEVSVTAAGEEAEVRCEVEAAEALPPWLATWPWVGWPLIVVLLFAVHQLLVRRRSR
jgi:hypothetical protein